MNYNIDNLKGYEILHAYCEAKLGPVIEHGNYAMCACPFGQHQRHEHLQICNKDGIGLAHCFACEGAGTVLDVAAAVMGINLRKPGMFLEVARHVAEVTGVKLNAPARRSKGRTPIKRFATTRYHRTSVAAEPVSPILPRIEYLSTEDANVAYNAVELAHTRSDIMQLHAKALGIPHASLMRHTEREHAERGLLGLTPDGRLLYVYTRRDEAGNDHVAAVKLRGKRTGEDTRLYIRHGKWRSRDLMQYDNGQPMRFLFSAGKPSCLYGADALQGHHMALLTEGESDKLALDYVLESVREELLNNTDSPEEGLTEEDIPIAIAKPSAGTFKPEWAVQLSGKAVIIIADADEAGRKGAEATAARLHYAGAMDVCMWTPPIGFKDVREMITQSNPLEVFENIINNSEPLDIND